MPYAINICQQEAEAIQKLVPTEVLICIDDPDMRKNLKVSGINVLRLMFADVKHGFKHKGIWYKPISEIQAHEIIRFVKENYDKNIIINCTAGVSRSSAIALFIHLTFGHDLRDNFWLVSRPNPVVLGTLISEYHMLNSKITV